jgi:hypothetical protein
MDEFYIDDAQSGVSKYILKRGDILYSGKIGVRKDGEGEYETFFKFVMESSSYKGRFEIRLSRGKLKQITLPQLQKLVTVPIELKRLYKK